MAKWLSTLEKTLEAYSEGSHDNYRVYMSAEPAGTPENHIIPQGILESSIKITNEPPTGMLANLHQSLDNFNQVLRNNNSLITYNTTVEVKFYWHTSCVIVQNYAFLEQGCHVFLVY